MCQACFTHDVLVERPGVQLGDERLDGEEGGQDTGEHGDESEDNWDTGCHPGRSTKVKLQGRTGMGDVVVSKFLDPESAISSPADRDLAFDDRPVLNESGGPQDESGGVVRGIGFPEQPE